MKSKILIGLVFTFLVFGLFSGMVNALTPPTGGVDYWNLSSFTNLWGTHTLTNDGTASSTTYYPVFGISGNSSPSSSYFGDSTDSAPTNYIPPVNKNVTFSVWVRPTSYVSAADFIFDSHNAASVNSGYYCIINNADSKVTCAETDGNGAGSVIFTITSNKTLPLNKWTLVTFQSKGNIGTDVAKLYFNKTLVGKASITTLAIEAASNVLVYGSYDSGAASNYYSGYMDNIKIYNKSLIATEVESEYNYGSITYTLNATITAKSTYNSTSILSFSVNLTNGTHTYTRYTSTGIITTPVNYTMSIRDKWNITFWNNSNHFNKQYLNYNFSIHSNNAQGNLTRSFIYANVKSNFNLASITFNATVNEITTYLAATKNTKLYLEDNNLNDIYFSAVDYKTQLVLNINTSSNLTITLNRTYQYIFPRNKSSNLPIAYFNISNGTHTYLNAQNTTKIYCYNICNFSISSKNFMNSYFSKDSSTNKNINLTYAINKLYFKDNSAVAIQGLLIQITYPSGYKLNRTTNSVGMINFSSIPLTSNETGTYSFHIYEKIGYVSSSDFTEILNSLNIPFTKNYTIYKATINVNIFDRFNHNLLLRNVSLYFLTLFNDSTNTGTYSKSNTSMIANNYTVQALSSGYGTEQQTFEYVGTNNISINFYLLNLSQSNAGTLFVTTYTQDYKIAVGTRVSLLEYSPYELSFIEVSSCLTNLNGECTFNIELGTKTYYLRASKIINGELYFAESPASGEIISTDNEVRPLVLFKSEEYILLPEDNLVYSISESFVANLSNIIVSFYTTDGLSIEMCVEYFLLSNGNEISVTNTTYCIISSSAVQNINAFLLLNRSNSYRARIYFDSGSKTFLTYFDYESLNSLTDIFGDRFIAGSILIVVCIFSLAFCLYVKNISLFFIITPILSFGGLTIMPSIVFASTTVFTTILCIFGYSISRKIQDTE